jgi:hypothetical protein
LEDQEQTPAPAPEKPKYWAALPAEDFGSELVERVREYFQAMRAAGLLDLFKSAHSAFFSLSPDGSSLESAAVFEFGDNGEKLGVRSNQLRSLVRYMLASTTADRPTATPKAVNASVQAMSQVPVARRIFDYFMIRGGLEQKLKSCVLRALLYGKGYLCQAWDPSIGKPGPDGKPEGDLVYSAHGPHEVACDLNRPPRDHDWLCVRKNQSKYDLAAVFGAGDPDLQDELLALESDCLERALAARVNFSLGRRPAESDQVSTYHFYHRVTPSMPEGRYCIMAGNGKVLFDGALPYADLPVTELIPEEFLEAGSLGFASAWDLMGLQQAYDSLLSTCMTSFDAYGIQDMLLPDGIELSTEEVRDGLNVIRYPPGEHNRPTMLEKFALREEVFKLRDWIKADLELSSGVNSVARGEPSNSLKSGSALALVQAQAIHFQSGLVEAYVQAIEDGGSKSLRILKQFAQPARLQAIAGANDPDGLRAFSQPDLGQIDRLEVERVNPVFRTLAGKFDLANNALDRGLITDLNTYFQVLETGRLEPVTDPKRRAAQQVQAENELLMSGPPVQQGVDELTGAPKLSVPTVPAVWTDDPVKHIQGHATVLDSPEVRSNANAVMAVTAHIQAHLDAWRGAPKDALLLLGYPMPPMLPGEDPGLAQGPPAPGQAPTGPTQDQGAKPAQAGQQPGQDAPDEGSGMPSLPKPAQPPAQPAPP